MMIVPLHQSNLKSALKHIPFSSQRDLEYKMPGWQKQVGFSNDFHVTWLYQLLSTSFYLPMLLWVMVCQGLGDMEKEWNICIHIQWGHWSIILNLCCIFSSFWNEGDASLIGVWESLLNCFEYFQKNLQQKCSSYSKESNRTWKRSFTWTKCYLSQRCRDGSENPHQ